VLGLFNFTLKIGLKISRIVNYIGRVNRIEACWNQNDSNAGEPVEKALEILVLCFLLESSEESPSVEEKIQRFKIDSSE